MNKDSTTISESGQQTINKIEYSEGSVKQFQLAPQARRKQRKTKAERDTIRNVSRYQSQDEKSIYQPQSEVELSFFERKRKVLKKKQELLNRSIFSNKPKGTSSTFTKLVTKQDNLESHCNDVTNNDVTNISIAQHKKNRPEQGYVHQLKRNNVSKCKSEAIGHIANTSLKRRILEQINKTFDHVRNEKVKKNETHTEETYQENEEETNKESETIRGNTNHETGKSSKNTYHEYKAPDIIQNNTPSSGLNNNKNDKRGNKIYEIICCKSKLTPLLYIFIGLLIAVSSLACYFGLSYFNPTSNRRHHHHGHHYHSYDHHHHHNINKTLTRQEFSRLVSEYNRLTHQDIKIPFEVTTESKLEKQFLKMTHIENSMIKNFTVNGFKYLNTLDNKTASRTTPTKITTSTATTATTTQYSTTQSTTKSSTTTSPILKTTTTMSSDMFSQPFHHTTTSLIPNEQINYNIPQAQIPYWTGSQWVWTTQNAYKRGNIPTVYNQQHLQQTSLNPMNLNFDDKLGDLERPAENIVTMDTSPMSTQPVANIYHQYQNDDFQRPFVKTTEGVAGSFNYLSKPSNNIFNDFSPSKGEDTNLLRRPTVIHDDISDENPSQRDESAKPIHDDDAGGNYLPPSIKTIPENEDENNEKDFNNDFERHHHVKHQRRHHHRRKKIHRHLHHRKHHRRRLLRRRKKTTPPQTKTTPLQTKTTATTTVTKPSTTSKTITTSTATKTTSTPLATTSTTITITPMPTLHSTLDPSNRQREHLKRFMRPHKLHWDDRHHKFKNDDQLSKIFNAENGEIDENPTRRKNIRRAHKHHRHRHRHGNLRHKSQEIENLLYENSGDFQVDLKKILRKQNRHHRPISSLLISGDGEDFLSDSSFSKEQTQSEEGKIGKRHHLNQYNSRKLNGLDNFIDAVKSGHHFIDPSLKTIFEDAAAEFFIKNKKHEEKSKKVTPSHNITNLKIPSNHTEATTQQIDKNKDQNIYLKMISDLKKEIEEVKNKTIKTTSPITPVTTTSKITTTFTKPTTTRPSTRQTQTTTRSIKRHRKKNNLLALLRAKIRKLRRKKHDRKEKVERPKVVKTYKVKSCVVIKKFPPTIKISITRGPVISKDQKIAYTVKACKQKQKSICRNIHYKISTGRLLIRKQRIHGRVYYMVIGCKKPRDDFDNLQMLDEGSEFNDLRQPNHSLDNLKSFDEGSATEEEEVPDEMNEVSEKRRKISKHPKHRVKKHTKHSHHKSHHHSERHHKKKSKLDKGKNLKKQHHQEKHKKPTKKTGIDKTTVKTEIKGLVSIIKDMRKEIKKQSGHKLNEKDLVGKMQKLLEQNMSHNKEKKKKVEAGKKQKKEPNITNKQSKNLNSENLMFSDDDKSDVTAKSEVEKPNDIYDDLFDNHKNKVIKNDEIRNKNIEDTLKNSDDDSNGMFTTSDQDSIGKNFDEMSDGFDQLVNKEKLPHNLEENKSFGEIGSSYKTVGRKQTHGGFDYPLDVPSKHRHIFQRKHDIESIDESPENTPLNANHGFMFKNNTADEDQLEMDFQDKPAQGGKYAKSDILTQKEHYDGEPYDFDAPDYASDEEEEQRDHQKKNRHKHHKKHGEHHVERRKRKNMHHHHRKHKTHHRRGHYEKRHKHHHQSLEDDENSGDEEVDYIKKKKHSHKKRNNHHDYDDDDDDDTDLMTSHKKHHKRHSKKKQHKKPKKHHSHGSKKKSMKRHHKKHDDDDKTMSKVQDANDMIESDQTKQSQAVSNKTDKNDDVIKDNKTSKSDDIESMIARIIPAVVKSVQKQNTDTLEKRSQIPTARPSLTPTKPHFRTTLHLTTLHPRHSTTPKRTQHHTTRHPTHTAVKQHKTTQANINMIIKGLKALGIDANSIQKKEKHDPTKSPSKQMLSQKTLPPFKFHLHDPTKMKILCFGDSLTAGYNSHGKNFFPYCSRLQDILNYRSSIPVYTETKGVVGEMTHKQMTNRLPLVLGNASTQYDWVIILGGTNDILHVKNFADDQEFLNQLETVWQPRITKDIEKLHHIANKAGARTMLLTVPENSIEAWPEYKPLLKMRQRINDALRKFAMQSNGRTVLCDIAKKLPRHSLGPTQEARLWDDHLHMTPEGYTKMAGTVADCMRPFLQHPNGW